MAWFQKKVKESIMKQKNTSNYICFTIASFSKQPTGRKGRKAELPFIEHLLSTYLILGTLLILS